MSAGAISRAQIESVGRRELELRRRRFHVGDDGVKERLFCLLEELQDSGQDWIRTSRLSIVLRESVND